MRQGSSQEVAVGVRGATKSFRLPRERVHTLKEWALHPMRRRGFDDLQALQDVSFSVVKGEFFGIVGRNGSGKSTLLKCLAGIYGLDSGTIIVDGRMSTFIELGVGFNPDLAARDNVVMNGIMLGLSAREARARYDRIIDFAELRDYEELKLKNYSSGMHVRLAFSVAIQVEADIVLIDEVLAVGDAAFQQKCFDVFHEMRREGRTVLFVTHDMGSVARMCDRALLLEAGRVAAMGGSQEVAARYLELNFNRDLHEVTNASPEEPAPVADAPSTEVGAVRDSWVQDASSHERVKAVHQGHSYEHCIVVELTRPIAEPAFTVLFLNEEGQDMLVATTAFASERPRSFQRGARIEVRVRLQSVFRPGRYDCALIVAHREASRERIQRWDRVLSYITVGPYATGGMIDVPHEFDVRLAEKAPT